MSASLIERVLVAMQAADVGQAALADFCGRSQGHVSKVLSGRAPLTPRMEARFSHWLETVAVLEQRQAEDLEDVVQRLAGADTTRRKHIMNILRELSELA